MFQLHRIICKADRQTMKLINLTKLTTSNLLSLLGYPCILLSIYNEFIFSPLDWADLEGYQYDRDMLGFVSSATSALYFMLAFFFFLMLLLLTISSLLPLHDSFNWLIKFLINLNLCIKFCFG